MTRAARIIDARRSQVYAAEDLVSAMVDRGAPVAFHGSTVTPELDRKYARVADIDRYLAWVRSHEWGYPEAPEVKVRVRKGATKATWESPATLAVPDAHWARRELVVLHEYAHHVVWHCWPGARPTHGPVFCRVFADLVSHAVGPGTGLLLTDAFFQAGLMSDG